MGRYTYTSLPTYMRRWSVLPPSMRGRCSLLWARDSGPECELGIDKCRDLVYNRVMSHVDCAVQSYAEPLYRPVSPHSTRVDAVGNSYNVDTRQRNHRPRATQMAENDVLGPSIRRPTQESLIQDLNLACNATQPVPDRHIRRIIRLHTHPRRLYSAYTGRDRGLHRDRGPCMGGKLGQNGVFGVQNVVFGGRLTQKGVQNGGFSLRTPLGILFSRVY